jgi:hypothetical protein
VSRNGNGTEINWDSAETVTRKGQRIFVDENGEEWTFDQLRPGPLLVIWNRPYKAPQHALGLFTIQEAISFLRRDTSDSVPGSASLEQMSDADLETAIGIALEEEGYFDTERYHIEWDK